MNFLPRLGFVLKEGFQQLLRARGISTAIIVIVAATLLQLSIFLGISRVLDKALGSAREKFEMAIFLAPASDAGDIKRLQAQLAADPRVASVKVVTKEAALQEFRKDPEIDRMVLALGENPLTDSISVILNKDATDRLDDLVEKLKGDRAVEEVSYGKGEWETVSNLSRLARWVGFFLGGFIFLTALFIVSNTLSIALWARREDWILLSRMGAPTWMRWGPYLWEGVLQGFCGGLLVVVLLGAARHWAGLLLQKYGSFDFLLALSSEEWWSLYQTLVLLGMILGALGAFLALQKRWVKELQ
ncbi:MAG TPA: permease-like cell division protein FtsX [bacterium]|nr:permease-like cell division protein FtsX [bacterium]